MPRDRQRLTLESGPVLDLRKMIPRGVGRPGARMRGYWQLSTGEKINYKISLDEYGGQLDLSSSRHGAQSFRLASQDRHFGGRQWFIICPTSWRRVRVLYRPLGAAWFATRHGWGKRRAAYASQFLDPVGRAWRTKAKIKNRLIGTEDPDEWDLPPKPKWMRWSTYARLEARYDAAEEALDYRCALALARLLKWAG